MKILISEPGGYSPMALSAYRSLGDVLADKKLNREELLAEINDADILVIRLGHKINREVFESAKKLKFIACPTTGLDHIDLECAKERGVRIISLKGETEFLNTVTATAELSWGLLLSLVRKIPAAFDSVKSGAWDRDKFKGVELRDKTLGVIGCGRLGKIMVRYGNSFFMNVLAHDPFVDHDAIKETGAQSATISEIFEKSDFISVHVPLNKETENLIGEKEFGVMKHGAHIINTSRGKIIDETAMLRALQDGRLAGAAVDVMSGEEAGGEFLKNNQLLEYAKTHDNLIIVPHIGGATYDSMRKTEDFIAEKIIKEIKN